MNLLIHVLLLCCDCCDTYVMIAIHLNYSQRVDLSKVVAYPWIILVCAMCAMAHTFSKWRIEILTVRRDGARISRMAQWYFACAPLKNIWTLGWKWIQCKLFIFAVCFIFYCEINTGGWVWPFFPFWFTRMQNNLNVKRVDHSKLWKYIPRKKFTVQ